MSIDPASYRADLPENVALLGETRFCDSHVYAFDFDGVVCSSLEDDIYHMATWDGEEVLLSAAERYFGIRSETMELKYRRHLLYQACAFELKKNIEEGPAISHVKEACKHGRVFLLTARSGWYAVERMRLFLKNEGIIPIEVFNVGRTGKDKQIKLLCSEFVDELVLYIEDNQSHLAQAASTGCGNLKLILAERAGVRTPADELRRSVVDVISSVINCTDLRC